MSIRLVAPCLALLAALALAGCAALDGADDPAFRPAPPIPEVEPITALPSAPPARRPRPARGMRIEQASDGPVRVWLYQSAAAQAALMKLGLDPTSGTRRWDLHLRATRTPFKRIGSAAEIGALPAEGVLILPSVIALSDAEKDAVRQWRGRGGSVLATWMTGTHGAAGDLQGFAFMRDVLDVEVHGDTGDEPIDTFMVTHGDSPPVHTLPAGLRMWMERIPGQLPLRLSGPQHAAQITNWSRQYAAGRPSGLVAYGERQMPSGHWSRAAVIGFPEQNWQRADPRQLQALNADLLGWLLRQPSAYVGAWPHPYGSGLLFALKAIDPLGEPDVALAEAFSQFGGRMTCYVLGDDAAKNAPFVRRMQALGHELAFFGDRFEPFERQPREQQAQRLAAMRQGFASAGFGAGIGSFGAPQDGLDETTLALASSARYDSVLATADFTEAQLPFLAGEQTVVLPRTLAGPAELVREEPERGFEHFLTALDRSTRAGALSVVRLPSGNSLPAAHRSRLVDTIRELRTRAWIASAGQIAQWWRDRAKVSLTLRREQAGHVLSASVAAPLATQQPLTIWVDPPHPGTRLRLRRLEGSGTQPTVAPAADGRLALAWAQPTPGAHRWLLEFEPASR
jgi:hypothetical protein